MDAGTCKTFVYDVFGLKSEDDAGGDVLDGVMNLVIDIRKARKQQGLCYIRQDQRCTLCGWYRA